MLGFLVSHTTDFPNADHPCTYKFHSNSVCTPVSVYSKCVVCEDLCITLLEGKADGERVADSSSQAMWRLWYVCLSLVRSKNSSVIRFPSQLVSRTCVCGKTTKSDQSTAVREPLYQTLQQSEQHCIRSMRG